MKKKFKSGLLWALAGCVAACLTVVMLAFTIYPGLQEALPANFWSACIFFGGPGLIAGFLIRRFSKNWFSSIAGFAGIIPGVLWHLHLSGLSAQIANAHYTSPGMILTSVFMTDGFFLMRWLINIEYRVLLCGGVLGGLIGLAMLLSPALISILVTSVANNIMKQTQGFKKEQEAA